MKLLVAFVLALEAIVGTGTSARAEGAAYIGAVGFKTCSQYRELSRQDLIISEFQSWTYGYWSARNQVNSHEGKQMKNLAHASVLGDAFFERVQMQCLDQPSVSMIAIIQQVYFGLPPYN